MIPGAAFGLSAYVLISLASGTPIGIIAHTVITMIVLLVLVRTIVEIIWLR